jgi:hypothetical protein
VRPERFSYKLISVSGKFVINIPSGDQLKMVDLSGTCSGRNTDKFKKFNLTKKYLVDGYPPVVAECRHHLFCDLLEIKKLGTHDLFIAEITHEMIDRDCFEQNEIVLSKINPIVYCPNNYMLITDSVGKFGAFGRKTLQPSYRKFPDPEKAEKNETTMEKLICVKASAGKGLGVFATRDIRKDEVIVEFTGPEVTIESLEGIPGEVQDHLFNIGTDRYIIAREPEVRTNHSCEPNAGIRGTALLVAMRDIKKDEEVMFDYSMITADGWKMDCLCGSPSCRGVIGNYRDLPESVKTKYRNYTPDWIRVPE